ncbi:MAG TPA: glycoside hydrolase family 9 protein [Fimbriimonas sp.]|nr:glycoside hydrolase family 9 protein [Fimbriimonas sp.]
MASDYSRSTTHRWLAKKVLASKLLDDCESVSTWTTLIEDQGTPEIALTGERSHDGRTSLRLRSKTTGATPIPHGRYYGTSSAFRVVQGEDWSGWNRLSFWVYPDLPGFRNVSMIVIFHNGGKEKLPEPYGKMGKNYVLLKNGQWNHVVWEIGNLPRDKVSGIEFAYRVQGNEPGATDTVQYDIDQIELQKVDADKFEGWSVAPGKISFSHAGYSTGSPKTAISSDLTAKTFQLIDAASGRTVLSKPVRRTQTTVGRFQVLDFTEATRPGTYYLKAGARKTQPFRIGSDVWESSLSKAINFFYAERCGYAIPGVHDVCHADWVMKHEGKSITINGGWHDAGDLSQNLSNTAEADYAMFTLAERLQTQPHDPALFRRLVDEASWGLQFVLNTSFHDGFRTGFNTMDRWTDGIEGTPDDMVGDARRDPIADLTCASDEAIAYRVLAKSDPILAAHSLRMAKEDWKFGTDELDHPSRPRPRRDNPMANMFGTSQCEMAANGALASLELWKSTGERQFADKAVEYGRTVLACQETSVLPGLEYPLTGFFYRDTSRKTILRYVHLSREQLPTVALVKLCELLPNHADWMKWYTAVTLYSKYYQQAMTQFTRPYGMLANSLFRDDEYEAVPAGMTSMPRDSFRDQVLNGIKVGDHWYVRRFPVWFEFRGNHGTTLAQATGLSEAAHLRGDYGLESLLQEELEWVIGRNPFVESTMWSEGYDYAPQYTAMSGDIVGSLPVGIETLRDGDAPYWPTENCHNWKEVWVNPTGRWIWLMKNLSGTGQVSGAADGPVVLTNKSVGATYRLTPAHHGFHGSVPEGVYEITCGSEKRKLTVLPGGSYRVDLRGGRGVELRIESQTSRSGVVRVKASVSGVGKHTLTLLSENLRQQSASRSVKLSGSPRVVEWGAEVLRPSSPWVALVVVDGKLEGRVEVTGSAWRKGR